MARDIEAGRAFVRLSVKKSGFQKGMAAAQKTLLSFGKGALVIGAAATTAAAAIGGALTGAVFKFAKAGDQMEKMSRRTGIAVASLGELKFAAEQSGTNIGNLEIGIRRMQKTIGDASEGTKESVDALKKLGLTTADLAGKNPEEQFEMMADRIAGIEDPTQRAAAAMEVFGRSGTQLLPLLEGGAAGMNKMREQAQRLGAVMSDDQAKAAADVTDAWNEFKTAIQGVAIQIGSKLAPVALKILKTMTNLAVIARHGALAMIDAAKSWIKSLGAIEGGFGLLLDAVSTVIMQISEGDFTGAFETAAEVVGGIWDTMTGSMVAVFADMINRVIDLFTRGASEMVKQVLRVGGEIEKMRVKAVGFFSGKSAAEVAKEIAGVDIVTDVMANQAAARITALGATVKSVASAVGAGGRARAASGAGRVAGAGVGGGFEKLLESLGIDPATVPALAGAGGGGGGSAGLKGSTMGSFSAAALGGIGGGTQDRIAKATEDTRKHTKETAKLMARAADALDKLGFTEGA